MRHRALTLAAALAISFSALAALATPAHAFTGKCVLQVDGKTYIDGPCPIRLDSGGDFVVGADDKKAGKYFATVSVNKDAGNADGFWNAGDGNHAHTPLGTLTRKGACWTNARARICAEK